MHSIKYEGAVYDTHGELPAIGSRAPDVLLVNTSLHDVSLSNWLGLRLHEDFAVLMISYDLPFAHARFLEQHSLTQVVGLSAIRHQGFGQNYGVQIIEGPLAGMFSRAVIVLDENNTVVHREQIADISDEPDYEAAYRSLGITVDLDLLEDQ